MDDAEELVKLAMSTLSSMNVGRRVVLYLEPSMIYACEGGWQAYLPTMNVEGDTGFYQFPERDRVQIARWFGAKIGPARERVKQINAANGVSLEEAWRIVNQIIVRGRNQ